MEPRTPKTPKESEPSVDDVEVETPAAPSAADVKVETPAEPNVEVEAPVRVFALHAAADGDEDAVTRVSVGCSPRVSVGAGERFSTDDPKLADQLARTPELEELT